MRSGRLAGAGLAAVTLAAILAGTAHADPVTETVSATGSPSGVEAICPQGTMPDNHFVITNGDGTPLGKRQRWDWTGIEGGRGVAVWIAAYFNSPPPPPSITLTVHCVC